MHLKDCKDNSLEGPKPASCSFVFAFNLQNPYRLISHPSSERVQLRRLKQAETVQWKLKLTELSRGAVSDTLQPLVNPGPGHPGNNPGPMPWLDFSSSIPFTLSWSVPCVAQEERRQAHAAPSRLASVLLSAPPRLRALGIRRVRSEPGRAGSDTTRARRSGEQAKPRGCSMRASGRPRPTAVIRASGRAGCTRPSSQARRPRRRRGRPQWRTTGARTCP